MADFMYRRTRAMPDEKERPKPLPDKTDKTAEPKSIPDKRVGMAPPKPWPHGKGK